MTGVLLAAAPSSHAGVATMRVHSGDECDDGGCVYWQSDSIDFVAGPGETNDLRVTVRAGAVVFEDRGARVVAGRGCASVGDRRVRCRIVPQRLSYAEFSVGVRVALGDGPDRARLGTVELTGSPEGTVQVAGEAGDDRLVVASSARRSAGWAARPVLDGGDGNDRLRGSRFPEELVGGAGADVLTARGGDDVLIGDWADWPGSAPTPDPEAPTPEPVSPDVLDGGPGRDGVVYASGSVVVDLADPSGDGRPAEGDRLIGIEDVRAAGEAVLRGDDADNTLEAPGPPTRSLLDGRGGDDVLIAGSRAIGGPGDDLLMPFDGAFECGPGTDVFQPLWNAVLLEVPRGCERAFLSAWLDVDLRPLHRRGSAVGLLVLPVPAGTRPGTEVVNWSGGADLVVTVRDARDSALLASTRTTITEPERAGVKRRVRVPLTAAGMRRLRGGRRPVRVSVWANATHLRYPSVVLG